MIIFFFASVATSWGQSTAVDRYFQDLRLDDRFTHVSVSSKMFDLFVNFEREDEVEQQVIETISKLKGLRVLVGNDIDRASSIFYDIVEKPYQDMEELMQITEAGKAFRFFIMETGGTISELTMVGFEGNQIFILSLVGDIDLKEISELSKKMNIDGFQYFENIN